MKERILAIEDMIKIIEYIVQKMLNLKTPAIKHLRNMRHYERPNLRVVDIEEENNPLKSLENILINIREYFLT